MDGVRLLAAGQWRGPLAAPCPSRVAGSNVIGGDPVRPEARAASRRARGKRLRGAGLLRRNGKTIKAPGEARPPRTLPELFCGNAEGR